MSLNNDIIFIQVVCNIQIRDSKDKVSVGKQDKTIILILMVNQQLKIVVMSSFVSSMLYLH